jgi:glutamyl-tRNA synthetase
MVKVRFAPSPTGFLHLGSARTALLNWLYARHTGGEFYLRIEDTDRVRSDEKFLNEILSDLKWMGLDWDGDLVYQSQRFDVYREEAEKILASGKAYKEGDAIIFKVEKGREVEVADIVHGDINFNTDQIKDQVMIKSDGSPAYNFCCVVDDAAQGITHIIRGDDHLSNTPKQILFYEAIEAELPKFAHIPLMMGSDGAKLSKRHGAVAVEEYRKEGILPEALANYLILLGWSPGEDRELIELSEAVKLFDIADMGDVQSRFDGQKLKWMNAEYIMKKPVDELIPLLEIKLDEAGLSSKVLGPDKFKELVIAYQVRFKTLNEFASLTDCFFTDDYAKEDKGYRKYLSSEEGKDVLRAYAGKLEGLGDFSVTEIEDACRQFAEEKDIKAAKIIHPTRVAISGKTGGASLFEMMYIMGKEKVLARMMSAAE